MVPGIAGFATISAVIDVKGGGADRMVLISRRTPRSPRRPHRLPPHASDSDVVAASLEHPEVFATIFERHHATIWRFVARVAGTHHADDLAGDVFVTAFTHRAHYEPERGSVRSWLYGLAANLAKTRLRSEERGARTLARFGRSTESSDDPIEEFEDAWILRQRVTDVIGALESLRPGDREILVMYAGDDLSYEEIAEVLGIALGTVSSRLARARQHLREHLPASGKDFTDASSVLDPSE